MDLSAQIRTALQSQNLPPPSQAWLQSLISSRRNPPPLPSLVMTAKTRLLATDLTAPGLLDPAAVPSICLPQDGTLGSPEVKEARLPRDVFVQVLDVENLSRSRWDQVEELEAIERGEQTRGREVVRLPPPGGGEGAEEEDGDVPPDQRPAARQGRGQAAQAGAASAANATHKLVLQDCKGHKVFALELKRVDRIGIGRTNIGEKMLLKSGAAVARGVILLEPATCVVLGGKVEAWQKAWVEGRLTRLRDSVGANRRD